MKKKLICLDTETTGFSNEYDRIVEIGCTDITHGWEDKKSFQKYINPKRSVPAAVVQIHGLTEDFLSQFQEFEHHIDEFLEFIEGSTLIIHNAQFDVNFLNAELARHNREPLKNEVIDTLKIAKTLFPGKKVNLNALQTYYDINIAREYHGALLDSEILAQIYLAMQTKQTALEIKNIEQVHTTPSAKLIQLDSAELDAHEKMTLRN